MAQGLTVEQLAQKVKEKYPGYANVPDAKLAKAVIDKYPVYQTHLSTGELERIAASQAGSTVPANYGFTGGNALSNIEQGLKNIASIPGQVLKDITGPATQQEMQATGNIPILSNGLLVPLARLLSGNLADQQKAVAMYKSGQPIQAAGYGLASEIPLIGPWAASIGEQAGKGDVGGALARGLTETAAMQAPRVLETAGNTGRMAAQAMSGASDARIGALGKLRGRMENLRASIPVAHDASLAAAHAAYPEISETIPTDEIARKAGQRAEELNITNPVPGEIARAARLPLDRRQLIQAEIYSPDAFAGEPEINGMKTLPGEAAFPKKIATTEVKVGETPAITFDQAQALKSSLLRRAADPALPSPVRAHLMDTVGDIRSAMYEAAQKEGKLDQYQAAEKQWSQHAKDWWNTARRGQPAAPLRQIRQQALKPGNGLEVVKTLTNPKNAQSLDVLQRYGVDTSLANQLIGKGEKAAKEPTEAVQASQLTPDQFKAMKLASTVLGRHASSAMTGTILPIIAAERAMRGDYGEAAGLMGSALGAHLLLRSLFSQPVIDWMARPNASIPAPVMPPISLINQTNQGGQ